MLHVFMKNITMRNLNNTTVVTLNDSGEECVLPISSKSKRREREREREREVLKLY